MERAILHIDMDAYFASVEERCNPFLKNKPVIVAGNPQSRTTVATANYKAREYGIKSGMPLRQALRLCPSAEVVAGNSAKYLSTTSRLHDIFTAYTPWVEFFSIDEAFLDITGSNGLYGGAAATAHSIKANIKSELGLTCSAGIAPNKLVAKLASDWVKPDGLTLIRREDIPRIFSSLPVEKLCGIGGKVALKLNLMGIKTCRDLAEYPENRLTSVFGVQGRILHMMGRGEDPSQVKLFCREEECKSMGHSYTLFRDTSSNVLISSTLYRLCEQVARRLRRDSYSGRTVHCIVRLSDFSMLMRQKSMLYHTDDGHEIYGTAISILETFRIEKPVRLLGVSVASLVRGREQVPLFEKEEKRRRLLEATDRINDKYGEFTVAPGPVLMEKSLVPHNRACHGFIMQKKGKP